MIHALIVSHAAACDARSYGDDPTDGPIVAPWGPSHTPEDVGFAWNDFAGESGGYSREYNDGAYVLDVCQERDGFRASLIHMAQGAVACTVYASGHGVATRNGCIAEGLRMAAGYLAAHHVQCALQAGRLEDVR